MTNSQLLILTTKGTTIFFFLFHGFYLFTSVFLLPQCMRSCKWCNCGIFSKLAYRVNHATLGRADQGRSTWAGGLGSAGGATQVRQTIKVLKYCADVEQAEKAGVRGSGSINIGDLELIDRGKLSLTRISRGGRDWTQKTSRISGWGSLDLSDSDGIL